MYISYLILYTIFFNHAHTCTSSSPSPSSIYSFSVRWWCRPPSSLCLWDQEPSHCQNRSLLITEAHPVKYHTSGTCRVLYRILHKKGKIIASGNSGSGGYAPPGKFWNLYMTSETALLWRPHLWTSIIMIVGNFRGEGDTATKGRGGDLLVPHPLNISLYMYMYTVHIHVHAHHLHYINDKSTS